MRKPNYLLLGVIGAIALVSACSAGSTMTATAGDGRVAFHAAAASVAGASSAGGTETITRGSDVLQITGVQLVLRKLKLESASSPACENDDRTDDFGRGGSGGSGRGGADDSLGHHRNDDNGGTPSATSTSDCGEVRLGPVLVDLPLGAGAAHQFDATLPAGTYHELHFRVQAPSSSDTAFLAAHPDFAGTSIKVTGTFNQKPFTYTSDLTVAQNVHLATPLVVAASGSTALTLSADLSNWFVSGSALVDPATALKGGANEAVVTAAIRASFRAFHDGDHDGHED